MVIIVISIFLCLTLAISVAGMIIGYNMFFAYKAINVKSKTGTIVGDNQTITGQTDTNTKPDDIDSNNDGDEYDQLIDYPIKAPFSYTKPTGWTSEKITKEPVENVQAASYIEKIYSPSRQIYIEIGYENRLGGFGAECFEAETQKYVSLTPTILPSFSEISIFEAIVNDTSLNKFFFSTYLGKTVTNEVKNTLLSQGYCGAYSDIITNKVPSEALSTTSSTRGIYYVWRASIKSVDFVDSNESDKRVTDQELINTLFASEEYKTAKTILLSAKSTE